MLNRLSVDELAYHKKTQQYLLEAKVIHTSWVEHLTDKYKLSQGDIITLDGFIERKDLKSQT